MQWRTGRATKWKMDQIDSDFYVEILIKVRRVRRSSMGKIKENKLIKCTNRYLGKDELGCEVRTMPSADIIEFTRIGDKPW